MGVFLNHGIKPYDDDGVKVVVHDEDGDENIKIMIILLSIYFGKKESFHHTNADS